MNTWTNVKRVARYGLIGFIRNGFVSFSAVLIMTMTLFVVSMLMFLNSALNSKLTELVNRVDVNVYFLTSATEAQITDVKQSLEALPEVASVTYVSREQALTEFRERHKGDQITLQALDELNDNPFGAALEIRAKDTSQYEAITKFIEAQQQQSVGGSVAIDDVNFNRNRESINRLTDIIQNSRTLGAAVAIIFGFASIVIAFNTIRLAIYTSRDEIGVMNIVGAGNWYVRGPFMVAGMLYGVVSGLIVLIVLYPLSFWLGPPSESFIGSFNTFAYYVSAFPVLFLTVMGVGIVLGALSSFLAVRRYLGT